MRSQKIWNNKFKILFLYLDEFNKKKPEKQRSELVNSLSTSMYFGPEVFSRDGGEKKSWSQEKGEERRDFRKEIKKTSPSTLSPI